MLIRTDTPTSRKGRKLCLGPTHEEVVTELVSRHVSSYRQLPLLLYQIQTKFRDERRPRFGVVRACEFVMKDAYSFDKDQQGLQANYEKMLTAYKNIFKRCGLDCLTVEADSGVMGGSVSHEFMVPAASGEDLVLVCPTCRRVSPLSEGETKTCSLCNLDLQKVTTVEVGHIFQLGTKYTQALGAQFLDDKGKLQPIIMGCYGIGVSRLIAAVIEQNHDAQGIIWPREVSPFEVILLALDVSDGTIMEAAGGIYRALQDNGVKVLFDDRDERAGVKFKDADLLGIPLEIIIGKEFLKDGTIEVKSRRDNKRIVSRKESVVQMLRPLIAGTDTA